MAPETEDRPRRAPFSHWKFQERTELFHRISVSAELRLMVRTSNAAFGRIGDVRRCIVYFCVKKHPGNISGGTPCTMTRYESAPLLEAV